MYRARGPLTDPSDAEQGDIIAHFWRPQPPGEKNVWGFKPDGACVDFKDKLPWGKAKTRVVADLVEVPLAMVVSNSCDNASGTGTIVLVPIRDMPARQGPPDVVQDWKQVSEAATGTATPKLFYLPNSPKFGIARRSQALLSDFVPVRPDYLARCVKEAKTQRICGLTPEAQRHLQSALALVFGRNARDDYEWPSREDIELKIRALQAKLERGSKTQERDRADLELAQAALVRWQGEVIALEAAALDPSVGLIVDIEAEQTPTDPSPGVEPKKSD
ncbi:MAG: hypothetical protein JST00_46765 [Deltaproteobacteria bacterium]|nr:hypothetical protein [Deltaproteobacteria bacterium]